MSRIWVGHTDYIQLDLPLLRFREQPLLAKTRHSLFAINLPLNVRIHLTSGHP